MNKPRTQPRTPPQNESLDRPPTYTSSEKWLLFRQHAVALLSVAAVCFLAFATKGCRHPTASRPPTKSGDAVVLMEITAYDSGQKSCNWKYDSKGNPVIASGKEAGKPKIVGLTASGKMAAPGTIAADTRYYPFGTVMNIPGYGVGVVQDRGGAIKGKHRLDVWFPSEREALEWGRKKNVPVTVRKPEK